MKKSLLFLLFFSCFCVLCNATPTEEAGTDCEEYPNFQPKCYTSYWHDPPSEKLRYYLSVDVNLKFPYPDRVWIAPPSDSLAVVMNVTAAPGENIDILSLERGYYKCWVKLGDCIKGGLFYKRHRPLTTTAIINPSADDSSPASRKLRDGQLIIESGEKVYTVTGQEVR